MGQEGPKISMGTCQQKQKDNNIPGPGSYECSADMLVCSSQPRQPHSPRWGFGTSPRTVPMRYVQSPGPGAYEKQGVLRGPKFSMSSKRDMGVKSSTPGPGAYESANTSFGY